MNNRVRQIRKAERMLQREPEPLLDRFLAGIDWRAFNESVELLGQALRDMLSQIAEAFDAAVANLKENPELVRSYLSGDLAQK